MSASHRTRKIFIIALFFLLSILFHMSSVIYVVWQGNTNQHEQSPEEKKEAFNTELKKREEWVETKARAGNFGAPVMFQDEPSHSQTSSFAEDTQDTSADKPDESKQDEITPPEQKLTKEIVSEQIEPKEKSILLQEPLQKNPITRQKKRSALQKNPIQPSSLASGPKPPLSLAQLTQGFLNHVRDEGKHTLHMLGKKDGIPSDEQIKHERYLEKLSWCLQNSFNIHNDRFPRSAMDETNVHILLSLNKDGTLKHCNVAKTSGNIQLDQFTLFVFNDASSSFPPVPHYLPHDPFAVTYIIMINQREQNSFRMYRR